MRAISRPRRGIGDVAIGDLGEFAHQQGCPLLDACDHEAFAHGRKAVFAEFAELMGGLEHAFAHLEADHAFDALMRDSGLEDAIAADAEDDKERDARLGNVYELRRWWLGHAGNGGSLADFIQRLSLLADREEDSGGQNVRLMTVHAAKGLEFDHVYIIGMEDGGFPHRNAVEEQRLEEERRLMYVAVTRARFHLTLSCAKKRKRFGQIESLAPSQFLDELGEEHIIWVDREPDSEAALEESAAHMQAMRKALGLV